MAQLINWAQVAGSLIEQHLAHAPRGQTRFLQRFWQI